MLRGPSQHPKLETGLLPLAVSAHALCFVPGTQNRVSMIDMIKPRVPGLSEAAFYCGKQWRSRINLSYFKCNFTFKRNRILIIFTISGVSFHSRIRLSATSREL